METEGSIYRVCSIPPLFPILSQTEYISHHAVLFLTILFLIILSLCLREPNYESFTAFHANRQNYIYIFNNVSYQLDAKTFSFMNLF